MKASKVLFCLLALILFVSLDAQDPSTKGGISILKNKKSSQGSMRAVVFGISDYADEGISDLNYAHKDAQAVAEYLSSEAGGNIPRDKYHLYYDKDATSAQLAFSLDWLLEESEDGDKAIIYFSGHSDVEAKFKIKNGYLLTHDSPAKVYTAGAFPLYYLNQYISALTENNVDVIVISDACHSGKLAGSADGGSQAATATLAQQFTNEIKIMSCQPDEFSIEGEQWGGGRGVFSYYLVEGLSGSADLNNDATVNLLELGRFLEDNIPKEAAPHEQMPMTFGDRNKVLAFVGDGQRDVDHDLDFGGKNISCS